MKSLSCDQCDEEFTAPTFEAWCAQVQAHYVAAHMDYMMKNANATPEDIKKWFEDAKARFDAVPENS
ncbi:MAG: hypothetical protein KTR28_08430 [Micavibrio sp.]|nr:hypothetical protein [Micavibrio sp.]